MISFYKGILKVSIGKDSSHWIECFSVRHVEFDFNPFIGFTAETGAVSDNHEIRRIHFYTVQESKNKTLQSPTPPSSTQPWWLFWIVLFIVAGIYYFLFKKQNRKRF